MTATLKKRPPLFMIDGPDWVGKTTQIELLKNRLQNEGYTVEVHRLLGGTDIGEAIRALIFQSIPRPAETNLYLNMASYVALAEQLDQVEGDKHVIIVDRSPLSIIGYQVYGDELDGALGYDSCQTMINRFNPTGLLVYIAPVETLFKRRQARNTGECSNYFEDKDRVYFSRVCDGYSDAAKQFNAVALDAIGSVDDVHERTWQAVTNLL